MSCISLRHHQKGEELGGAAGRGRLQLRTLLCLLWALNEERAHAQRRTQAGHTQVVALLPCRSPSTIA